MVGQTTPIVAITSTPAHKRRNGPMTDRRPVNDAGADLVITLSVIISTYNAREVLADCLQSIYQNPPSEPYEIIVVDDASADGTSDMVRARFPEVRLLRNEINRHYTYSNNRAFDEARGQYVHLLNNDTIVLPQALDHMLAFLREHPEAGAVGSKLLNEDGTTQWSVKSLPDLGSALFGGHSIITRMFPNNRFSRKRFLHLDRDMSHPFVAGYLSGASKMMPRSIVDEVGYLDNRMFYHVDADYCKRIAEAVYKCYYLPTATVVHLNHKGGTMVSSRQRFRSLMSFHVDCYIYYCKHLQRWAWSPLRLVVLVGLVSHFLALFAIQTSTELVGVTRALSQKRPAH
jgi:N-acetylglucosaminyl-diphospho-decaprenol L-rhamnosyltransferase